MPSAQAMNKFVEVLITVIVIGLILVVLGYAYVYYNESNEQAIGQTQTIKQLSYQQYDSVSVTGADVIEAAKKFKDKPQFSIHIITGVNTAGYFAENSYSTCYATPATGSKVSSTSFTCSTGTQVTTSQMKDPAATTYYINMMGRFTSTLYTDSNNDPRLIEFVQKN